MITHVLVVMIVETLLVITQIFVFLMEEMKRLSISRIMKSDEQLRPYLIGVKFTVFSDHESLSYLNASKINSGR